MGLETEVATGTLVDKGHIRNPVDAGNHNGEESPEKDQRNCRVVADTENDNGNGYPGDGADGPQQL